MLVARQFRHRDGIGPHLPPAAPTAGLRCTLQKPGDLMSDLLDINQLVTTLRVSRRVEAIPVRVFTLDGDATELAPPGSLTVVHGTREAVRELADALEARDVDRINDIAATSNKAIQGYRAGLGAVERTVMGSSSFVDVHYGGQVLAAGLVPDDRTFTRVVHPYLGGGLDEARFSAGQYHEGDADDSEVIIVLHEPAVDDVTRSVLDRLDLQDDAIRIGVDPNLVACTVTATPVVVAVTVAIVATAATSCAPSWNDKEWYSNPDPIIGELAPTFAVSKLLALRASDFMKPSRR